MMKETPNIILCTCDQLRAFEVGCYGNDVIQTPSLDRLAAGGVRFETAVSNYPVCLPARSVLVSGQYNRAATGGVGNVAYTTDTGKSVMPEYPSAGRPHLKQPTLPEVLREHGYRTSVIGKWHIHAWPHDVGFDDYLIPRVHHCHTGQCFTENGGPEFSPPGYSVEFEADRVERFLGEQAGASDPFFLYYNISVPHCPLADAPERYCTMYRPEDVPLRANVDLDRPLKDQDLWFKVYRYDFRHYQFHLPYTETLPPGYTLRHLIAEYYGMTTWMDTMVGRMLDALDRHALTEDTLVIFTSDHGDNLGSNGLVQKGGPNEESIRIPLILRWPSRVAAGGANRSHVASLVDIAPTLLSLIGLPVPGHFHGRDLAALCRGEPSDAPAYAVIETGPGAAVRSADRLVFLPFVKGSRKLADTPSQVFDMVRDPYQQHNLADRDEMDEQTRQGVALLRQWEAATPWMEA